MLSTDVERADHVSVTLVPTLRAVEVATVATLCVVVWCVHSLTVISTARGVATGTPRIHRIGFNPDECGFVFD